MRLTEILRDWFRYLTDRPGWRLRQKIKRTRSDIKAIEADIEIAVSRHAAVKHLRKRHDELINQELAQFVEFRRHVASRPRLFRMKMEPSK